MAWSPASVGPYPIILPPVESGTVIHTVVLGERAGSATEDAENFFRGLMEQQCALGPEGGSRLWEPRPYKE